jgi:beta-glucosidase
MKPRHRRSAVYTVFGMLVLAGLAGAGVAEDKPATLLSQMSLEEKMALIRGEVEAAATNQGQAGYLTGVRRLAIPALRLADGPPGVLTRGASPALTATMGLAATFSRADARDNGIIIGDEANRLGIDIVLEPFINLDRDLAFERGYNTYGEDPVLTGVIGADLIKGIQGRGVMAEAKHYIGYDTGAGDVTIAPQALREVYLAPFDDAVKAGVAAIMCSYNRINGSYSCGNPETLTDILRGEMKFEGFVTSDWGAVHDYDYLAKGLDMEMPGRPAKGDPGAFYGRSYFDTDPPRLPTPEDLAKLPPVNIFTGRVPEEPAAVPFTLVPPSGAYKNLSNALSEGVVTLAMIDRAALRVLRQMDRFGYFDGSRDKLIKTPSGLQPEDVIRRTAEDAAVLLKNDGDILPLRPEKSGAIALIGPGAAQVVAIGKSGERSVGLAERQIGPYAALQKILSNADLRLAVANDMTGVAVPPDRLARGEGGIGLSHTVNDEIAGVDAEVDFTGIKALPPGDKHTWTGTLVVPAAGHYVLAIQTLGARATLAIDGKVVAMTSGAQGGGHGDTLVAGQDDVMPTRDRLNNARTALDLTAGPHALNIEAKPDGSGDPERIRFAWVTPQAQAENLRAAVAAAAAAKTAVVFVWSRDIPLFALPGDQDKLVEAVAAANPNTIVVMNVSQPVAMPWLAKVKGVVQMWWPGDEGGWATADILSGRKNPAGRLPFTWGKSLADYPATDPKFPERSGQSLDGKARFSEGLDVGYRWFERRGVAPLYPFGFGLSYTHFDYSQLKLARRLDGGLTVQFTLKNTGAVDGEEVPQVYLSPPQKPVAGASFALKALAGFDRIALKAGETRTVTIAVDTRRLQYWSPTDKRWITAGATRTISVGPSSQDLRLKAIAR